MGVIKMRRRYCTTKTEEIKDPHLTEIKETRPTAVSVMDVVT